MNCKKCGQPLYEGKCYPCRLVYGTPDDTAPASPLPASTEIGDTVFFGRYNQNEGVEPLEWLVLDKKDGQALLLTKYGINSVQFHTTYAATTWAKCRLRFWLNFYFLSDAFTQGERAQIVTTTVSADPNPSYSSNPGEPTSDPIFLLSILEAEKYFPDDASRLCVPTPYTKKRQIYTDPQKGTCWWWLRTPGSDTPFAALVDVHGKIYERGYMVDDAQNAVRPAIWVKLGS